MLYPAELVALRQNGEKTRSQVSRMVPTPAQEMRSAPSEGQNFVNVRITLPSRVMSCVPDVVSIL